MLKLDPEWLTEVYETAGGHIAISQPSENCPSCGAVETMRVFLSTRQARLVADALTKLAYEMDRSSRATSATGPVEDDNF